MESFLRRYVYWFDALRRIEYSFVSCIVYLDIGDDEFIQFWDNTRASLAPSFVKKTEAMKYARKKLIENLPKTCNGSDAKRYSYSALSKMYSMYRCEAIAMGCEDDKGGAILAAIMAGYIDLPESKRSKLCELSEVFKKVEEEYWFKD